MTKQNTLEYKIEPEIKLTKEIRFHPKLTPGEKLFLSEINSLCSLGECYYQPKQLGKIFSVSSATVSQWVKKFVELGLIEVAIEFNNKGGMKHLIRSK